MTKKKPKKTNDTLNLNTDKSESRLVIKESSSRIREFAKQRPRPAWNVGFFISGGKC